MTAVVRLVSAEGLRGQCPPGGRTSLSRGPRQECALPDECVALASRASVAAPAVSGSRYRTGLPLCRDLLSEINVYSPEHRSAWIGEDRTNGGRGGGGLRRIWRESPPPVVDPGRRPGRCCLLGSSVCKDGESGRTDGASWGRGHRGPCRVPGGSYRCWSWERGRAQRSVGCIAHGALGIGVPASGDQEGGWLQRRHGVRQDTCHPQGECSGSL